VACEPPGKDRPRPGDHSVGIDMEILMENTSGLSIEKAMINFIELVAQSRSENTARSYANAMSAFGFILDDYGIDPAEASLEKLPEDSISWFAGFLKDYAPSTEQMYLVAVTRFFQYLAAEELAQVNLQRINLLRQTRARKPGVRLPQFPKEDLEKVIQYAASLHTIAGENLSDRLRNYRDRAFILTLADTGMRVHEACNLRRGDLDWMEHKALIIGKGNQQAVIRFSKRSIQGLKDYLAARAELDGMSGRPLTSLPLFARHDKGAGSKIKPIATGTGRNIVNYRVAQTLGANAVGTITPHSFRHYFVTNALVGSGGNLKLAQELARHKNIQVTQRYAHLSNDELDRSYAEIFDQD